MSELNEFEKPNFYAIIPANVRYDKRLSPNAKLFYAEISSILQFNNRCYASNAYFSRVFEVSEVQVSRIIKQLVEAGHISVDYKRDEKGTKRYISLALNIFDKSALNKNDKTSLNKNDKHNSNNTNNNKLSTIVDKRAKKKSFVSPSEQEVVDYFKEKGYSEESAKKAFEFYETGEWKDSRGTQVKNWKQKMISVWFKEENKAKEVKQNKLVF